VLADGFGNLPPKTNSDAARVIVERIMVHLSPSQRAAITPRMKWEIVAAVANNHRQINDSLNKVQTLRAKFKAPSHSASH
jgi:hypothetical protein